MRNKDSKTNSFGGPRTPIWVWVIIFIIFLQIAKLAHRNNWFIEKKYTPGPNEEIKKLLIEKGKLLNKETN